MIEDYSQPTFYHFDQDSLQLVRFIMSKVRDDKLNKVAEFGCGCGVITLELLKELEIGMAYLFEKQQSFSGSLNRNIRGQEENIEISYGDILIEPFADELIEACDLVYFNPPYFFTDSSRAAKDMMRDTCRRIDREHFSKWFTKAKELLSPSGNLIFCHRDERLSAADYGFRENSKDIINGCAFYSWILF